MVHGTTSLPDEGLIRDFVHYLGLLGRVSFGGARNARCGVRGPWLFQHFAITGHSGLACFFQGFKMQCGKSSAP